MEDGMPAYMAMMYFRRITVTGHNTTIGMRMTRELRWYMTVQWKSTRTKHNELGSHDKKSEMPETPNICVVSFSLHIFSIMLGDRPSIRPLSSAMLASAASGSERHVLRIQYSDVRYCEICNDGCVEKQ
jgi:hypothetical protein